MLPSTKELPKGMRGRLASLFSTALLQPSQHMSAAGKRRAVAAQTAAAQLTWDASSATDTHAAASDCSRRSLTSSGTHSSSPSILQMPLHKPLAPLQEPPRQPPRGDLLLLAAAAELPSAVAPSSADSSAARSAASAACR